MKCLSVDSIELELNFLIQFSNFCLFIFVSSLFRFNVIINIFRSESTILLHVFCLFHLFFVPFVLIFALFGLSILFYFLFCLINYKYFVVGIISVVALKMKVLVAESYLTLCNPMDVACLAPLSVRFPRQEYWSGLPFPSPGDLSRPGSEPKSPALGGGFFNAEPAGKTRFL